jgi:hypothetical protein
MVLGKDKTIRVVLIERRCVMSSRFLTNAVVALAAGFVVVATQAFATPVVAWLAFALGVAVLGIALVSQLDRSRPVIQRMLDGVGAVLAIWTIVASLVFVGSTVLWLSFAEALGFVGLAFAGLTLREIQAWRAEHAISPVRGEFTGLRLHRPAEQPVPAATPARSDGYATVA